MCGPQRVRMFLRALCMCMCVWKWSRWEWGVINIEPPPCLLVCLRLWLFCFSFLCPCVCLSSSPLSGGLSARPWIWHTSMKCSSFSAGPRSHSAYLPYFFFFFLIISIRWFVFMQTFNFYEFAQTSHLTVALNVSNSLTEHPWARVPHHDALSGEHLHYVTPGPSLHLTSALVYSEGVVTC